jgi:hypothetical protein
MKACLMFVAAVLVAGCGTTGSVALSIPQTVAPSFQLQDERPLEQRTSHTDAAPSGTTVFYGDDNLSPGGAEIVRRALANGAGRELSGKTVKLLQLFVYVSEPSVSLDGGRFGTAASSVHNASPVGVVLAAPVILGIENLKSQKTVNVVIRGSVGDAVFVADQAQRFRGRVTEANIQSVLVLALDQAVQGAREAAAK